MDTDVTKDAPAAGRCPVVHGFDPLSQDFQADPFPVMNKAITEEPVFFYPPMGLWCISRYDDILDAVADFGTFSSNASALMPVPQEVANRVSADFFNDAFIAMDPPRHTISRKNVNKAFTRGRVADLEPDIEKIANDLIDEFEADGRCDLMRRYCNAVSLKVMLRMLGYPEDDLNRFLVWAEDVMTLLSPRAQMPETDFDGPVKPLPADERVERWSRVADEREYLLEQIHQRLEHPTDDLTSALVHAKKDDGTPALEPEHVATHIIELLTAGTDTTASLIGHLVVLLSEHPDQLEELIADPALWENAVEEGLRRRNSSLGMFRKTTRDVEVAGVKIPEGQLVFLLSGTASFEPERFPEPERFDIHRANAGDHIGFGKGRHFCLGAPLARTEAQIVLRVLFERLPTLRSVPQETQFVEALQVFLIRHLTVEWEVA
jgi:cytochrome P450